MTEHQRALAYAVHCLGVHEAPMGSNRGPTQVTNPVGGVDIFQTHDFIPGGGYAWCIDLILTAWAEAGRPFPYKTAGAYDFHDHYGHMGWSKPLSSCVPGDPVIFRIGSGHGALLERLDSKNGLVHTVDGNWNNRVQRVAHPVSTVLGAIHVPEVVQPVPRQKIPWTVTVTSASGHTIRVVTTRCTEAALLKWVVPALIHKYGKLAITIRRGGKK